jgi:hypothetical protein
MEDKVIIFTVATIVVIVVICCLSIPAIIKHDKAKAAQQEIKEKTSNIK